MKLKLIFGSVLVAMVLSVASPALALNEEEPLRFGVSPYFVELEVPSNGSATTDITIQYFDGDVEICLVNIPLQVEPSAIYVEASDEPVVVELTVYGNHSMITKMYDGYVQFIALSEEAMTGGIQIIAQITNVADGIAPLEETVADEIIVAVVDEPVEDEPVAEITEDVPVAEEVGLIEEQIMESNQKPWLIPVAAGVGSLVLAFVVLFFVAWKKEWVA